MAVRVVNASAEMAWEDIAPHVDSIKALLAKLQKRFPSDVTVEYLIHEVMTGFKTLWLIFDDDRLMATAMTKIQTVNATGVKIAALMDLAGENVAAWAEPLGEALEEWGTAHGVDEYSVEGRPGWGPVLEAMGYRKYAVLWRKPAKRAA